MPDLYARSSAVHALAAAFGSDIASISITLGEMNFRILPFGGTEGNVLTYNEGEVVWADYAASWDALTDKPISYPPEAHQHTWEEISNTPATYPPAAHGHAWADITNRPSSFPPEEHQHVWAEISDPPATYAPAAHQHPWADVTGKPTTFSPSAHNHPWADVTGKPTTFAPTAHNHPWGEVTGKPATYPPSEHTHTISQVDGLEDALAAASGGDALVVSVNTKTGAVVLTPADIGAAPASHSHAIGDVTDLSQQLAAKLAANLVSAFGLTLLDDADAAAMRTTLGLGAAALWPAVPNSHVTNARQANMAASTIKGRLTSSGAPQDLTVAQVKTLLALGIADIADLQAALNAKMDTTTFKTVNGQTITGTGNIQTLTAETLTQAAYDALSPPDPNVLYVIVD